MFAAKLIVFDFMSDRIRFVFLKFLLSDSCILILWNYIDVFKEIVIDCIAAFLLLMYDLEV